MLRPRLVSLYRDKSESKLRDQINLADLTAIARQRDPKDKVQHIFGLFTPSRNYHLAAQSETEALQWINILRREARIEEGEQNVMMGASPDGGDDAGDYGDRANNAAYNSSSDADAGVPSRRPLHSGMRTLSHTDYSGADNSDYSDSAAPGGSFATNGLMSALSLTLSEDAVVQQDGNTGGLYNRGKNVSQASMDRLQQRQKSWQETQETDRVVCHGWIHLLRSSSGVRTWKRLWMVLRPKSLLFYKNEEEYSAQLVIPFDQIINAVEIDAISKSKQSCMQILLEEKTYRLCATDDDALARWLGGFKSLLVKRRES